MATSYPLSLTKANSWLPDHSQSASIITVALK
jgi:hypothetical protein